VDQPRPDLLVDREQLQLAAEAAMVALERLLDALEVFQRSAGRERGA
jgi:hypothetical protein